MAEKRKTYPLKDVYTTFGDLTFLKYVGVVEESRGSGRARSVKKIAKEYVCESSEGSRLQVFVSPGVNAYDFPFQAKIRPINPSYEAVSMPLGRYDSYVDDRLWCDALEVIK